MSLQLITNNPKVIIATAIGAAMLAEQAAVNYPQTFVTVGGEILIACISGYCLIKVAQLKTHINSRMDELLKLTKDAGRAEGVIEGKKEERADVAVADKAKLDAATKKP